jgi:hypothetical protein
MDNGHISAEQQRYATLLSWGSRSGLVILTVSFIAYVFGWLPAHIPLEQLPNHWILPSAEHVNLTNSPTGWKWLAMTHKGDFMGLFGIAWLSGCSLICLAAIIPIYSHRKDTVFVILCVAALLIQMLAASGILHSTGH